MRTQLVVGVSFRQLRRGLLALLAAGSVVIVLAGSARSSGVVAPGACGTVLLAGSAWLGGAGVDVMSNGPDQGSVVDCSSALSKVGAVTAGEEWQCPELINRLYLTKGWITSKWAGDGEDLFDTAPSNLTKQANGSISSVSRGDVVSIAETHDGQPLQGGHAAIVNTAGAVTSGSVSLVSQNGGGPTNALVTRTATLTNGTLSIASGGGYTYSVKGVVHAPASSSGGGAKLTVATASRQYGSWIKRQYPAAKGLWICPVGDPEGSVQGGSGVVCQAEFSSGGRWHFLYTVAGISGAKLTFLPKLGGATSSAASWIRHWYPYTRAIPHEFNSPGVASPNAPVFDWSFLTGYAYSLWQYKVAKGSGGAVDGPLAQALRPFYTFVCTVRGPLVTCTNSLGDSLRYRPGPQGSPPSDVSLLRAPEVLPGETGCGSTGSPAFPVYARGVPCSVALSLAGGSQARRPAPAGWYCADDIVMILCNPGASLRPVGAFLTGTHVRGVPTS